MLAQRFHLFGKWGGRLDLHVIFCSAEWKKDLLPVSVGLGFSSQTHNVKRPSCSLVMMMMKPTTFRLIDKVVLIILCLGCFVQNVCSYTTLTADEFYNLKDSVNAIVDVRTQSEWDSGHIEGAMHVDSLSLFGTQSATSSPLDLAGCEYCDIIVYCRSGSRAGQALTLLEAAGFVGNLYNGLGVSQWTAANYPLVTNSLSTPAPCTVNATITDQCTAK